MISAQPLVEWALCADTEPGAHAVDSVEWVDPPEVYDVVDVVALLDRNLLPLLVLLRENTSHLGNGRLGHPEYSDRTIPR